MITSKYFKEAEFQRCVPSCSLQDMNQSTMNRADRMREEAGIPLILNSAYRSREWELSKGRTGDGSHTRGCGLDVRPLKNTPQNRFKIVTAALKVGYTRIGIAKTYVHVDDDPTKTPNVIWDYYA